MLYFLDFAGPELKVKDPESFLGWAKQREGIEVQDILEKFGETKTRGQKLQAVSEIRSFLKRNGKMDLPTPGMTKLSPARHHRSYRREEVMDLLSYLDQKTHKLYCLFAKDSGLRPVHILAVRYRHLKEDLKSGKEFVYINFEPPFYDGRKVPGRTFIGPETVKVLKECIDEKLIGNFEEVKTTDKDGRVRVERKYLGLTDDSKIFPFGYPAITSALQLARKKAKLDSVLQPSMGFRKFFENGLDKANLDFDQKRLIEGHSTGVRNRHYTDRVVDELRGLYAKSYKYLTLSGPGPETQETVETLQKKIGELETQLARQKIFDAQMTIMEDRLAKKDTQLAEVKADFTKQLNEMRELMFRELGINIGKEIGQRESEKKTPKLPEKSTD